MPKRAANIMGSSFYRGAGNWIARAADGQSLRLEREPTNQYDANAIKVMIHNNQLGHIGRSLAAHLAPLMDAGTAVSCVKLGRGDSRIALEWEGPDVPEEAPKKAQPVSRPAAPAVEPRDPNFDREIDT